MNSFVLMLEKLLSQKGVRRADLIRATGIPNTTIASWYKGSQPSADKVLLIAAYFGVTVEYLLTGKSENNNNIVLNDDEKDLLEKYRRLNAADKNSIMTLATGLASQYSDIVKKSIG